MKEGGKFSKVKGIYFREKLPVKEESPAERKLEVTSKFFPGRLCVSADVKIEYSTVEQEAFGIL